MAEALCFKSSPNGWTISCCYETKRGSTISYVEIPQACGQVFIDFALTLINEKCKKGNENLDLKFNSNE